MISSEIGALYYLAELYDEHTLFWRGDPCLRNKSLYFHDNIMATEFSDWLIGIKTPAHGYLNPGTSFKKKVW